MRRSSPPWRPDSIRNQLICPDHLETHGEPSSPHRLESQQGNPSTGYARNL